MKRVKFLSIKFCFIYILCTSKKIKEFKIIRTLWYYNDVYSLC